MPVTFEFYQNDFHGIKILSEAEFNAAEVKARAYVDRVTFERTKRMEELTHDIQMATLICDRFLLLRNGALGETVACADMNSKASPYLRELIDSTLVFSSEFSGIRTSWEPPA